MKWQSEGRRNRLVVSKIHKLTCVHQSLRKSEQAEEGTHLGWSPEELEAEEKAKAKQEAKEKGEEGKLGSNSNAIIL